MTAPVSTARYGQPLTEREIQVLEAFAQGANYAEIAALFYLGHQTVKNYASSAMKKLGARSQAQAVFLACQAGVLDPRKRRHGDHPGFVAHKRRGEEPCKACRDGENAYQVEWRATRRAAKSNAA